MYVSCFSTGLWGCVYRAEEDRSDHFGVCWQGFHLHLHPWDVAEMGRLRFCQVFHQCMVLAGLLHCGCKSSSCFLCHETRRPVIRSSTTPCSNSNTLVHRWIQFNSRANVKYFCFDCNYEIIICYSLNYFACKPRHMHLIYYIDRRYAFFKVLPLLLFVRCG